MDKLDGKFYGKIFREKDGSEVPQDSFVVFLARDKAIIPTLEFYREECRRLGCELPQLAAVNDLICRVQRWQNEHPGEMKVADTDPGEINTVAHSSTPKRAPSSDSFLVLRSGQP